MTEIKDNNKATLKFLVNFLYYNFGIHVIRQNNTLHGVRTESTGITYFSWEKLISVYNKGVESKFFTELDLCGIPNSYAYLNIATPRRPITQTRKELFEASIFGENK
jgi:hypothetical protein